jgi:hypothetical protein
MLQEGWKIGRRDGPINSTLNTESKLEKLEVIQKSLEARQ